MAEHRDLIARDARAISNTQKVRFFPMSVASAKGAWLTDHDGRAYLDFTAGWAVAGAGYGNEAIERAAVEEMGRLSFATLTAFVNEPAVELAEKLLEIVPGRGERKVWFGMHGSDACDTLYKLVPLATGRPRMVSYIGGYHGQTGGSAALSGHTAQARFIAGANVTKIPYPNCYRCPLGQHPSDCGLACLRYVEDYVFKTICPAEDVAGILVEAMQSDGGDIPAPRDYLPALEELCRKHGILLLLDEVKIGFGRSGKMFAFEHYGITPDGVALGKSLSGGYVPMSAVVASREVLDVGSAINMYTLAGNPVGCRASLANIRYIEEHRLMANAAAQGERLLAGLRRLADRHPLIGDVRGLGLMIGVELVTDRERKTPAAREAAKVCYRAWQLGLVVFYGGIYSNVLEITPPLIITADEVDQGLALLDRALADVEAGLVGDEALAFAGW
jgi:4-aminobutyrate aminotransferase